MSGWKQGGIGTTGGGLGFSGGVGRDGGVGVVDEDLAPEILFCGVERLLL